MVEENFKELQTAITFNTEQVPTSSAGISSSLLEISRLAHNALSIASSARGQIHNIHKEYNLKTHNKKEKGLKGQAQVMYPKLYAIYQQFENNPLFKFTRTLRNFDIHTTATNAQWRMEITDNAIKTYYLIDLKYLHKVSNAKGEGKLTQSGYDGTLQINQLFANYKNMLLDYIAQFSSCLEDIHRDDLKEYKNLKDQLYKSQSKS